MGSQREYQTKDPHCPALTCERGGELDNGRLSAEGIIPTGLTAVVIVVAVQRSHLVRPMGEVTLGLKPLPLAQCFHPLSWQACPLGTCRPEQQEGLDLHSGTTGSGSVLASPQAMGGPRSGHPCRGWSSSGPGPRSGSCSTHCYPYSVGSSQARERLSGLSRPHFSLLWCPQPLSLQSQPCQPRASPVYKKVTFLVAVAPQWLTDHIAIGVRCIPKWKK
jgi:hypothetical protein